MSDNFSLENVDLSNVDPKFKNTIEFNSLTDDEQREVIFTRMRIPNHSFEEDIRFLTFLITIEIERLEKSITNGYSNSSIKENTVKSLAEEACSRIFKRFSSFYLNGILLLYFSSEGLTNFIIEEITDKLVILSMNHNVTHSTGYSANSIIAGKGTTNML